MTDAERQYEQARDEMETAIEDATRQEEQADAAELAGRIRDAMRYRQAAINQYRRADHFERIAARIWDGIKTAREQE